MKCDLCKKNRKSGRYAEVGDKGRNKDEMRRVFICDKCWRDA